MSSLNRQLLWGAFAVGAPPLVLVALVSLWVASRQIESGLQERLLAGARGAGLAVGIDLDRIRARAAAVARDPILQQALVEGHQEAALDVAEHAIELIDVDRATLIDASSRVIARGHEPARDGDLWTEPELSQPGRTWSAVGSGSVGVGVYASVPVLDTRQRELASLLVEKAIDYAALLDLRSQFGLDFSVWDGDRLQATTLRSTQDIAEAERARRALSRSEPVYLGASHYFAQSHFEGRGLGSGTLLVAIDRQAAAILEARLALLYLGVAVVMLALTVAGVFFSSRRIVRPIRRLASAAEAAARGRLEESLTLEGPREIQELAESFSNMLRKRQEAEDELRRIGVELEERVVARTEALRQSEEDLRQSRQLEALGRLAGGVAHDFNNVLTAISGNAELVSMDLEELGAPAQVKEGVAEIQESAAHAAEIIRQLMAFSRQQVSEPVVLDLGRVILDLEKMLRRLCTEDVTLSLAIDAELPAIIANPTQIGQLLVNLVVNAQDALLHGGHVDVRVYQVDNEALASSVSGLGPGRHVCLEVADDGVGMDEETARRIFEPFFTTKEMGKGTGMGLATVHGIVKQCGAHVAVETEPGRGATFRVSFPAATAKVGDVPRPSEQAPPGGRETILICEDEPSVRALTAVFLRGAEYEVLIASTGREALEIASQRPDLTLLVTDVVMPEMNGVQLARQLRERMPGLKVLYLSGYTASVIDSRTDTGSRDELLSKPFTRTELLGRVRSALDNPRDAEPSGRVENVRE